MSLSSPPADPFRGTAVCHRPARPGDPAANAGVWLEWQKARPLRLGGRSARLGEWFHGAQDTRLLS